MLWNKVTKEIRKTKAKNVISIIDETGGNTKLLWKQIKKLMGIDHNKFREPLQVKLADNLSQHSI